MHKLLRRQLRKLLGPVEELPDAVRRFVEAVDDAYEQADHDRQLLERSLDLTSTELLEANASLRRDAQELERRVEQRTGELIALNQSLQREIAERRMAEEAIRKSEAKFRSLFEGSRDAIYISTRTGRLIDINPAGVALFGYDSKQEMQQIDVAATLYAHPEDRERFIQALAERGFVKDMEFTLRRKSGETLEGLITATGVRDAEGIVTAYRGIVRDVTEQRELEMRLQRSQRMEAVGRLAGGVAHDFNNLLTAIIGYGDLLVRDLPTDSPLRRRADEIREAAERGAGLTRQLLALSRRQVLRPRVIHLNRVVGDMDRLLRRLIGEDVSLVTRLAPELGPVLGDRSQIEQVVLNLAVNARDAMPHGGTLTLKTRNVELALDDDPPPPGVAEGSYVLLEVSDTGSGIPPEIHDKIFDPFFTTKEAGHGTGLGLSTVYGIVEQSGGHIEVSSRTDEGTTFRIHLPVADAEIEAPAPAVAVAAPVDGTETLLVAEDEPAVRMLIAQYLGDHGYTVLSASSGEDALYRAERHVGPLDLVVADIVMPGMSGIELAEHLESRRGPTRVLLISGYADAPGGELERHARRPGWEFLQKPFSTDLLARRIRSLLDAEVQAPLVHGGQPAVATKDEGDERDEPHPQH